MYILAFVDGGVLLSFKAQARPLHVCVGSSSRPKTLAQYIIADPRVVDVLFNQTFHLILTAQVHSLRDVNYSWPSSLFGVLAHWLRLNPSRHDVAGTSGGEPNVNRCVYACVLTTTFSGHRSLTPLHTLENSRYQKDDGGTVPS